MTDVKSVAAGAVVASLCLVGAATVLLRMLEIREQLRSIGSFDFTAGTDVPGLLTGGGLGSVLVFLMGLVLAPLSVVFASGDASVNRGVVLMTCGFVVLAVGVGAFELRMADTHRVLTQTMGDANFEPMLTASFGGSLSNTFLGLAGAALPLGIGFALLIAARR